MAPVEKALITVRSNPLSCVVLAADCSCCSTEADDADDAADTVLSPTCCTRMVRLGNQ